MPAGPAGWQSQAPSPPAAGPVAAAIRVQLAGPRGAEKCNMKGSPGRRRRASNRSGGGPAIRVGRSRFRRDPREWELEPTAARGRGCGSLSRTQLEGSPTSQLEGSPGRRRQSPSQAIQETQETFSRSFMLQCAARPAAGRPAAGRQAAERQAAWTRTCGRRAAPSERAAPRRARPARLRIAAAAPVSAGSGAARPAGEGRRANRRRQRRAERPCNP